MENGKTRQVARIAFWGRVLAFVIGVPIYLSLLTTLPAVGAVLIAVIYFGVPAAVRRAVMDPAFRAPGAG